MKNKDTEPTNQKRGLVLLVSFLLLFPIAWLHMRVAGVMVLSAFITLTTPVLVTMSCAAIYLYFSVSGHVRKLYYERFRWIPWIYNVLYYLIFWGCYGIQYTLYLRRVRTEEGYLFTSEGAFYSYVYKVFYAIFFLSLCGGL